MVYLAYPIDNANLTSTVIDEIEKTKRILLEDHGVVVIYDPGDAFTVAPSSRIGREISAVNNAALDQADAVLAWLPQGVASIGVPMEIAQAGMVGKPVAVLSDSWSWALRMDRSNVQVFPEGDAGAAIEWLIGQEYENFQDVRDTMPYVGHEDLGPTRAYADDAGLDLYVAEDTELEWGVFKDVPLGVNVALPEWGWGFLVGRSSTFRKRSIEVMPGIIDTGYRGPLFAACIWRPDHDGDPALKPKYSLLAGDRIAQMIIIPNGTRDVDPVRVLDLPAHERGERGFGSSGV
jgi:dUTP pyrophosphatase